MWSISPSSPQWVTKPLPTLRAVTMSIQSRLKPLAEDQMDDAQRAVLQEIMGTRGNLDGPFLAWVHSPVLANHAQRLGAFCPTTPNWNCASQSWPSCSPPRGGNPRPNGRFT